MTQCAHREWLASDLHFATGPQCDRDAEFINCDYPFAACAEHKCRCAKPVPPPPPATVVCVGCGDTEAERVAHDLGWRFVTQFDGEARWLCPGCQEPATDAEGRLIARPK